MTYKASADKTNNFAASIPPDPDDDDTKGYSVGSTWVDTATGYCYTCTDATASAAVWAELTAVAAHAASHTDGSDDVQDATAGQGGLATAAQITKLDGIESSADITDPTNVLSSLAAAGADVAIPQSLVTGGESGEGLKVDPSSPTFGWRDVLGEIIVKTSGGGNPNFTAFRGGACRAYAFAAGEEADVSFHIPHDYAPGTDVYLHLHWSHNGTAISGDLIVDYCATYAKGHNQEIFPAEVTPQLSVSTPDITTIPQYMHRIDEIQLSASAPAADQLDSDDIEVDGLIKVNVTSNTIPTITGGSPNEPFFLYVDLHYQSTGMPTKNKAPSFYV